MKIPEIKTQITENYKKLHQLAYIKPKDKQVIHLWQVNMNNWHASADKNSVWYKKELINVKINPNGENNVEIVKKPFLMWKKWVLNRVNKALIRIIDNYHNYDVVEKGQIRMRVYKKEDIVNLKAAAKAINQVIL